VAHAAADVAAQVAVVDVAVDAIAAHAGNRLQNIRARLR
jgi:hypothetical protein